MGKKVDSMISKVSRNVTPRRKGQSKKSAAIAILKSRGLIRQKGASLVLTPKGRRAG